MAVAVSCLVQRHGQAGVLGEVPPSPPSLFQLRAWGATALSSVPSLFPSSQLLGEALGGPGKSPSSAFSLPVPRQRQRRLCASLCGRAAPLRAEPPQVLFLGGKRGDGGAEGGGSRSLDILTTSIPAPSSPPGSPA